jgi:pimeloyl-ACP methyl ester carboxylesterase
MSDPKIVRGVNQTEFIKKCPAWDVPQAPRSQTSLVRSTIPTLILSGEIDPITPRPSADKTIGLTNSYSFTFPATGHGAFADNDCATSMVRAFLLDASHQPDSTCIASVPPIKFVLEPPSR